MPDKTFDMGDYVQVKDRIAMFYELYAQGRLVTDDVTLTSEPDGKPRVMVRALAYRTPDDPHPAVGYSWMILPGTSNFTRGSELENAETSAWGRAIAALGILIAGSIGSAQEVESKRVESKPAHDEPVQLGPDGLVGTVERGKPPVDMEPRQQAEGGVAWGFALKDGGRRFQVLAKGELAEVLAMVPDLTGTRATCWGVIEMIAWDKAGKAMPPYPRLHLSRIQTPEWTLPAGRPDELINPVPVVDAEEAMTTGEIEAMRLEIAALEPAEAETVPLFEEAV